MELLRTRLFDFGVRCLCIKHKQKQIKMATKLDGSEESMLPVLIRYSNELFGKKTKKNIVNIREFSVGRGIADLFVIEKDQLSYKKRQKIKTKAATDLSVSLIRETCPELNKANVIKRSVAIEAKVRDWRKGLKQATRYKSFADRSYLAVYDSHIATPLEFIEVFQALNIGLIGVTDKAITVYFDPQINQVNDDKYLLASERAYSIIDHTQDSFVVRNQFAAGGVAA